MLTVTKKFKFEAAHHLPNYKGCCVNVHGHSYKLEVTVFNTSITETDMVMDFSELSKIVKENIISKWDHKNLNELEMFSIDRPTAENMVTAIYHILMEELPDEIEIECIRLWETEDSYAEYHI
jgi:6-pyruvoyltetrahydropterin/6-carboxytetrahydropterin synthase